MINSLQGVEADEFYDIKNGLGHGLLLGDMCFFLAAVFDAQLHFERILTSNCKIEISYLDISFWATIGYVMRLVFTLLLAVSKGINLYRFVSRTQIFPRVGALFTPFMSSLLLTTVMYDYNTCSEVSSIFPIEIANDILTICSLVSTAMIIILSIILLVRYATGHQRNESNEKAYKFFNYFFTFCIVLGSMVGLVASVDLYTRDKLPVFLLFDTYSFVIVILFKIRSCKLYCVQLMNQGS